MFIFIIFLFGCVFLSKTSPVPPCNNPIYCYGDLLHTFQMARLFNDSKEFVDMPTRYPPEIIVAKFQNLTNHTKETLQNFLNENFFSAGSEVKPFTPKDWKPNPKFLENISDTKLKQWGFEVHEIWKDLLRVFDHNMSCENCFSSISTSKPFIVPGGRFHEFYYWDNLWIVQGLLISEMYETAMDVIENLLEMVEKYGFVLNGARVYYEKRSQPPVLTIMVHELYKELKKKKKAAAAKNLLKKSFPLLKKEYEWWMSEKLCKLPFSLENVVKLNCFSGFSEMPRPESYREDLNLSLFSEKDPEKLFKEIAGGAETGWDFSTRFFEDFEHMSTINTSRVIPVDLNSILYKVEVILSEISAILGDLPNKMRFKALSLRRQKFIMQLFFDEKTSQWRDIFIENLQKNPHFYPSNFAPLWAFQDFDLINVDEIVKQLKIIADNFIGGLPTSLEPSGQQWDFPNAWPPLQSFIIEGLLKINTSESKQLAKELAQKFVDNSLCGWIQQKEKKGKGAMFEKYNALERGQSGHGGEYEVQEGFGWTNGVALKILKQFGRELKFPTC